MTAVACKVLLVDDDYLVRQFLRQLIDWAAEGLDLYADVANGQEALQIMQETPPDILISDISMPVMDGIALIHEVKQRGLHPQIIVLSCHDEFEYVREAMKLGAHEYILKHMLSETEFLALIRNMRDSISRSSEALQRQAKLNTLTIKGLHALKKEMIQMLLEDPTLDQAQLLSAHGIQGEFRAAAVMVLRAHNGVMRQDAVSACRKAISGCFVELIAFEGDLYALIDLSDIVSAAVRHEILTGLIRQFQSVIKEQTGETPYVGVSEVQSAYACLSNALSQARKAISLSFYGQKVAYFHDVLKMENQLPDPASELEKLFCDPYVERQAKALLLKAAVKFFEQNRTDPTLVLAWIARMDAQCPKGMALPPVLFLDDCMQRRMHYEAAWGRLLQMPLLQTTHNKVETAAAFIRAHYFEPISLAEIAAEVELNPAYLSYLFKHEAGVNFSEYLCSCRMHRVKHLLAGSDIPIKEAAAASGFSDYQHFCKQFRQLFGIRPNEFRMRSKNTAKI